MAFRLTSSAVLVVGIASLCLALTGCMGGSGLDPQRR